MQRLAYALTTPYHAMPPIAPAAIARGVGTLNHCTATNAVAAVLTQNPSRSSEVEVAPSKFVADPIGAASMKPTLNNR